MKHDDEIIYEMKVGKNQRIARMTKSQFNSAMSKIQDDKNLLDEIRKYVEVVSVYRSMMDRDVAEDLEARPRATYLARIQEIIFDVTNDKDASAVFASNINKEALKLVAA